MSWQKRVNTIAVGDTVKYSREFLKSTGLYTGPIPFARGTVESIKDLGGTKIATVNWGDEEAPAKVNVANLVRQSQREVE